MTTANDNGEPPNMIELLREHGSLTARLAELAPKGQTEYWSVQYELGQLEARIDTRARELHAVHLHVDFVSGSPEFQAVMREKTQDELIVWLTWRELNRTT